jgi:preprotein translocase subunit SecA
MIPRVLRAVFGSRNDRLVKTYSKRVAEINALEPELQALSDETLQAKTAEFKKRIAEGASLDDLLPEAFAVVREAGKRVFNMRHFDVQMIGGMVLHDGKIAEMRTGEGKTLVATLPAYLNALSGKGVHVVTVNDYLAARDAEWMGKLYNFLGLSVGVILSQMPHDQKHEAYAADITYGTNNEYGFDYLRDNMAMRAEDRYQRALNFAIVDEVDSILIDEARTPLIISGQADDRTELYQRMDSVAPMLKRQETPESEGDFWVDEKAHTVVLSEAGHEHAEQLLERSGMMAEGSSLYEPANINLMHHLNCTLRAHNLFFKDRNYVVQNSEVIIVDEFTGRMMPGRRWSEGLHQAIEAKERVSIQSENQTLASITFQNFFRMYGKLSGMTGTADTEAYEFQEIYGLETVVIPTHKPMVREDRQDQIYKTAQEKYAAILNDIKDCHTRGQPVLVGTTSIETSELLSRMLDKDKLPHQVLNAKQHEREAQIVAQAGRPRTVTIATNMAGRGTDIVLGGNVEKQAQFIQADPAIAEADKVTRIKKLHDEWQSLHDQVVDAGGLHIIGTERHESRRIDNQLRGRSGRQGDPGSSRFYLSLEDQLLRIFAGDFVRKAMDFLKLPEGEAIEHKMVTNRIEAAQRKVESHNFDIRKQLLEYDNVANEQRRNIYQLRNDVLDNRDVSEQIRDLRHSVTEDLFRAHVPPESIDEQWDLEGLQGILAGEIGLEVPVKQWAEEASDDEALLERVKQAADDLYAERMKIAPPDVVHHVERNILLQVLDMHWREHLASLDHLRQGIHLRAYAQKNPKQEYKREAFELFGNLIETVKLEATRILMRIQLRTEEEVQQAESFQPKAPAVSNLQFRHPGVEEQSAEAESEGTAPKQAPVVRAPKVGRNEPCPCGSGKKFKHCHGKLET